jgi:hypothetical protein
MNSLSWFLYLADIAQNFSVTFSLVGVIGFLAWCVIPPLGGIVRWVNQDYHDYSWPGTKWFKLRYGVFFFLLICLADLIPGQNTFYAIAASELAGKIVQNPQVQGLSDDATRALQAWLHKQLEPKKEKKDD